MKKVTTRRAAHSVLWWSEGRKTPRLSETEIANGNGQSAQNIAPTMGLLHLPKSGRRGLRLQSGVAAVEFALVLPVLLLLVFGTIEFSLALYDKAVITNASREAARAGIVLKSPKLTAAQIQAVALNYCQNYLIDFGISPPTVSVPSGVNGGFGTPLMVSVSYTYSGLGLGALISPLTGPLSLSATTVMNNE